MFLTAGKKKNLLENEVMCRFGGLSVVFRE